jgi:hypothetical protein
MADYAVVLFYSTAHALRAEKVLSQAGLAIKMIPTPRQLSSDCGMALRVARSDRERAVAELADNRVPTKGIHAI